MPGFAGVTPIDTSAAALTVSVVDPDTLPSVAVSCAVPRLSAAARPLAGALSTETTAAAEELQVTVAVRSRVE